MGSDPGSRLSIAVNLYSADALAAAALAAEFEASAEGPAPSASLGGVD